MQRKIDLAFNAFLFSFFLLLLIIALQYGRVAQAVPLVVIIPGLGLTLTRTIVNIRKFYEIGDEKSPTGDQPQRKTIDLRRLLLILLWVIALPLLIWILGFNIGSPLFVLLFLIAHKEKWMFSINMAAATGAVIYLIFGIVMKLSFYQGEFFILLTKYGIYMPF